MCESFAQVANVIVGALMVYVGHKYRELEVVFITRIITC